MVLYFIGLGLGDEKDITVRGLEALRRCTHVFLDHYTSVLIDMDTADLASRYGLSSETLVKLADRELVEGASDEILAPAHGIDAHVAFLVVGDPFGATTHSDLYLRAMQQNISVQVIHNASILNVIGITGLQLYSFGPTITLPLWTDRWRPHSPYEKLVRNWQAGQHTLCLLDIKMKEMSEEDLLKGRRSWLPPRFMTIRQAVSQLLESEQATGLGLAREDCLVIGLMRMGSRQQKIVVGSMGEFMEADEEEVFGGPLHSLIVPSSQIHELEWKMLQHNMLFGSRFESMSWEDYKKTL